MKETDIKPDRYYVLKSQTENPKIALCTQTYDGETFLDFIDETEGISVKKLFSTPPDTWQIAEVNTFEPVKPTIDLNTAALAAINALLPTFCDFTAIRAKYKHGSPLIRTPDDRSINLGVPKELVIVMNELARIVNN